MKWAGSWGLVYGSMVVLGIVMVIVSAYYKEALLYNPKAIPGYVAIIITSICCIALQYIGVRNLSKHGGKDNG